MVTGTHVDTTNIEKSINIIMNSGVEYEFRTTVVRAQLVGDDFKKIGELIKGTRLYAIQNYTSPGKGMDASESYSDKELAEFCGIVSKYVSKCAIR